MVKDILKDHQARKLTVNFFPFIEEGKNYIWGLFGSDSEQSNCVCLSFCNYKHHMHLQGPVCIHFLPLGIVHLYETPTTQRTPL